MFVSVLAQFNIAPILFLFNHSIFCAICDPDKYNLLSTLQSTATSPELHPFVSGYG